MAFRRQVKNFVKNYSDAEIKVREATSNDPWGPSSSLMLAISDLTFNTISLSEIMNMLWQRLHDHGKNWRHVYKSLTLMDYLIKNGSKKVIQHCRKGFHNLQMLKDFQHIDEAGKDQGHYVREKSKQVITLLMDEQLLHKEREVARRTRRRTSYSMTFPDRLPDAGNTPTACASVPTTESPAPEKKHALPQVAGLRNKKNASKPVSKQEQSQDIPSLTGTVLSKAWKSTEDLMLFCDEDPKPPLPTVPSTAAPPAAWLSEGLEVCNRCGADVGYIPSEKSSSLQANVNLSKKSDNTIISAVTESPSQTPQKDQMATKRSETLATLSAFWPSSKEEILNLNFRMAEPRPTFHDRSSVETLYSSPSFRMVGSVKKSARGKERQRPAQDSITQMDDGSHKPLATKAFPPSEGRSSCPLPGSSPGSVSPKKPTHCLPLIWARPSFWALSSSASFKLGEKAARTDHLFSPGSLVPPDEEEHDNLRLLESLPDNSKSAKEPSAVLSSNGADFSPQTVDHLPSTSCAAAPTTEDLPRDPESSSSIRGLLGEVKSAILRLHEDLRLVIWELGVINSHLGNLSGHSPQASKSLQNP
uniref:ENTH domain-containing protein 1 n=1 Tax=Jaculus jaculus TaxID=51337 RepID=UPI001E1B1226|nr:ENTH domain-containing protein 1 [Jaculus jaculus]